MLLSQITRSPDSSTKGLLFVSKTQAALPSPGATEAVPEAVIYLLCALPLTWALSCGTKTEAPSPVVYSLRQTRNADYCWGST